MRAYPDRTVSVEKLQGVLEEFIADAGTRDLLALVGGLPRTRNDVPNVANLAPYALGLMAPLAKLAPNGCLPNKKMHLAVLGCNAAAPCHLAAGANKETWADQVSLHIRTGMS